FFFFQAEDGIRDFHVTGVQTCALPISPSRASKRAPGDRKTSASATCVRSTSARPSTKLAERRRNRVTARPRDRRATPRIPATARSEERRAGEGGRGGGAA